MNKQQPAFGELHYGILHEEAGNNRHYYRIAIAPKEQLQKWEESLEGHARLFTPKKISSLGEMGLALERHYHEYIKHHQEHTRTKSAYYNNPDEPAHLGTMMFQINKSGGKTIAFAESYNPTAYYLKIQGKDAKRGSGINAGRLEAECLQYLKALGVSHMTTTDGYYKIDAKGLEKNTNQNRRNQLAARGIDPNKIYPISEWIEKLRAVPDYSKIRKI